MSMYFAERPSLALRFEHFIRELRDRDFAPAYALKMVNVKLDCVAERLAVFRKLVFRRDEIQQFALRKANGFSPVALKCCELPSPLRVSVRFMSEKLTAFP